MMCDRDMTQAEAAAHHKRQDKKQAAREKLTSEAQTMDCKEQIEELAAHILSECPEQIGRGDPQNGEGAIDVAMRVIDEHKAMRAAIRKAMDEIGVPGDGYLQPVDNAYNHLNQVLIVIDAYPAKGEIK